MGIDAFNCLRYLLNEILPFKQDIVNVMLNEKIIKEHELLLFISDSENEDLERKSPLVKKKI